MTDRTARNYMAAAAAFKDKSEIVSVLPAATVYALAGASTETRTTVVQQLEAGERLGEAIIRGMVQDDALERRQAAKAAKRTPEQRKREQAKERKRQLERKRENERREALVAEQRLATDRAAKMIVDSLGGQVEELLRLLDTGEYHGELVRALRAATS